MSNLWRATGLWPVAGTRTRERENALLQLPGKSPLLYDAPVWREGKCVWTVTWGETDPVNVTTVVTRRSPRQASQQRLSWTWPVHNQPGWFGYLFPASPAWKLACTFSLVARTGRRCRRCPRWRLWVASRTHRSTGIAASHGWGGALRRWHRERERHFCRCWASSWSSSYCQSLWRDCPLAEKVFCSAL